MKLQWSLEFLGDVHPAVELQIEEGSPFEFSPIAWNDTIEVFRVMGYSLFFKRNMNRPQVA